MAIGIPTGGISARGFGADASRLPAARARDAQSARIAEDREAAATTVAFGADEAPSRSDASSPGRAAAAIRVARVERLDDAGAAVQTNRGISAYLDVERGTVTDPFGGELVGIDFYV